jgi:phosphatidylglycerophosphatase C
MAEAAVAPASRSVSPVVVFDFDGTLVRRDSFLDFSVRYCVVRPGRLLLVTAMLPLAMLLATRSRRNAASALLWAMTAGTSTRRFVVALRRYARRTLPAYANEAIFAELARHVREGSHVVIATGTPPLLVRGLLAARNLGRIPVVGSRFRRRWGGLIAETYCTEETKAHELGRRFGIVQWSTVYTNSFSDRSLLCRARDITLVSPSHRTVVLTQRLIGPETVLRVLRPT